MSSHTDGGQASRHVARLTLNHRRRSAVLAAAAGIALALGAGLASASAHSPGVLDNLSPMSGIAVSGTGA